MCLPLENRQENSLVQLNFIAIGAAAARPSCMLLGGFFALSIKTNVLSLFFGQIVQGEPILLRGDATQPPAPLGDASVA